MNVCGCESKINEIVFEYQGVYTDFKKNSKL